MMVVLKAYGRLGKKNGRGLIESHAVLFNIQFSFNKISGNSHLRYIVTHCIILSRALCTPNIDEDPATRHAACMGLYAGVIDREGIDGTGRGYV